MHPYAQTNIQLFNQLRQEGYSKTDLRIVRDAYELAMELSTSRFQPSGRPLIAHIVGTASILASLRLPAEILAAALLHNVYLNGDFGTGRPGLSAAKRKRLRRIVGAEVEEYVARFPSLDWTRRTIQLAHGTLDEIASVDRAVLLILLADYLEHLLDLDILYYPDQARRNFAEVSSIAVEIAEKLAPASLVAELKQRLQEMESAEPPVDRRVYKDRNASFVIAPKSCRKRLSAVLSDGLINGAHTFRRKFVKPVQLLYQRSSNLGKTAFRKLPRGYLETKSEEFKGLFPEDASPVRVAAGFRFTEGPVWIAEERRILFSDIPANRILALTSDGRVKTFREPSGNSNGLTRDGQGRLIACEHGNRRVTRTEKDGSITILADAFRGRKLNSPNDVIVKSDGAIYFTDPPYGIKKEEQEQAVQGVYRLSPDGQELTLMADDLARPNGLAFSPDEKKLYIDDSQRRHIRVFDVCDDGSLSGGSLFHDMNVPTRGSPDGMKVDVEGHVYCTGAGGVWVFHEGGEHLGTIVTPEKPSNCAWGDSDWRTLYITAVTSIYKIRVNTPGIKVPST